MKKDIIQIALGTVLLGIVMDLVFFAIERFNLRVLWGTLLGCGFTILNFILLSLTVSKAMDNGKGAGVIMSASYITRLALTAVMVIFAIKSPNINYIAAVIPLIFPRIIITVIKGMIKQK